MKIIPTTITTTNNSTNNNNNNNNNNNKRFNRILVSPSKIPKVVAKILIQLFLL